MRWFQENQQDTGEPHFIAVANDDRVGLELMRREREALANQFQQIGGNT